MHPQVRITRRFEKSGPLWIPQYGYNPKQLSRYERYIKRSRERLNLSFSHSQNTAYNSGSGVSTSASLNGAPALGDVVCVAVNYFTAGGTGIPNISNVKDGAGNSFALAPHGPATGEHATAGCSAIYYLIAPANANKTITVTFVNDAQVPSYESLYVDDFAVTGGTAVFDTDAAASVASGATPTTQPVLSPAGAGGLLYGCGGFSSTATGVSGAWVQNTQGVGSGGGGEDAAYILSCAAGNTAVAFTMAFSQDYNITGAAFKLISGYTAPQPVGVF